MTTGLRGRVRQRLAVGFLSLAIGLTALPSSAFAGYRPSDEQNRHIVAQESALAAKVLVLTDMQGYGSAALMTAANAAKTAMRACMIAGYHQKLAPAAVENLCAPIVNAYLVVPQGATVRALTETDERNLRGLQSEMQSRLTPKVGGENAHAVSYTVTVCAKAHLKRNYEHLESGKRCAPIVTHFLDLPNTDSPDSPFSPNPPAVRASAEPPKPAAPTDAPPPPAPEPAEGEGWAGNSEQQATVGQDGSTQLTVNEQNLNAGQTNQSNTRTRPGHDDNKPDKSKNSNNGGGGNSSSSGNSNSNSGGGMQPHR